MELTLTDQLTALSHPQRLSIFKLLVRRCPDRLPAGEIAQVLDIKPSTASVYLSALTKAGLIRQYRQGTSLRYEVRIDAVRGLASDLFLDCCRGRPDICAPFTEQKNADADVPTDSKYNVLFVCSGNSARSILAEAILRQVAGDRFTAYSAGARPHDRPDPRVIALLKTRDMDTSGLRSKGLDTFQTSNAPKFDFVFTVCDLAANEECPSWAGQPVSAHWGVPDPVKATGTDAEKRLAFQQAFGALRNRIEAFAALPIEELDRISLQSHVDRIGRTSETL